MDEDRRKLPPAINSFRKLFLRVWPVTFDSTNCFSSVGKFRGGCHRGAGAEESRSQLLYELPGN
ncbi:hypothetical protein [Aromatoleum aromaticum]|uniref:hypothetical protein n=1 Tax=Aromatoleum aromaticum TaxID=551760 RepID=UPI0002E71807|nr:hypothetical protein [Aromatoleum aromaticum]